MDTSPPRTQVEQGSTSTNIIKSHGPSSFFDHAADRVLEVLGFGPRKKDPLHDPGSHKELREALEKNSGADMNATNDENNAPIHSLVKRKAKGKKQKLERMHLLVTLLTFADVDIEQQNGEGHRPLHLAVMSGDQKLIKVLIAFGAKMNSLNFANQTPLDLLKGPQRVMSISLQDSHLQFLVQERVTGIPSPTGILSPTKGMHTDGVSTTRPPLTRRQTGLQADALVSFRSSISSSYETGPGIDHMTPKKLRKLSGVLQCVGAERRQKMVHAATPASITKPSAISFTKCETTASPHPAEGSEKSQEFQTTRLQYYAMLKELISSRMTKIDHEFNYTPDEASRLVEHMREMKMLQFAGGRILFLDGGGLRGLIQVDILSQIEEKTGKKITELFDCIVGTSTGGIMALALVYAKKSPTQLRKFFFQALEDVFKSPQAGLAYDTDALEKLLMTEFGTEMKMSDVKHPRVIVAATYKEKINLKLHLFNNCFDDEFSDQLVWKVARYTSAGPVFFTEKDNYVDGGILAQNPSSVGLTAIQKYYHDRGMKLPISLVVSIGSGQFPDEDMGNVDATEYLHVGKHWFHLISGLSGRIQSLTTLLSNALTESETVSENCRFRCEDQGIQYFRFNPKVEKVIPAGESDLPTLMNMVLAARSLTHNSCSFHKLILRFVAMDNCRKKMLASYCEKKQKLEEELKQKF